MATVTRPGRSAQTAASPSEAIKQDPAYGAFLLLRAGFTLAPILFGIDKFTNWMIDWDVYLWSGLNDALPGTADQLMYVVGGIEIVAGLVVLLAPRIGGPLVAAWLAGIVVNLVAVGIEDDRFWDIALRDFGLMAGAIALSLLAWKYSPAPGSGPAPFPARAPGSRRRSA